MKGFDGNLVFVRFSLWVYLNKVENGFKAVIKVNRLLGGSWTHTVGGIYNGWKFLLSKL